MKLAEWIIDAYYIVLFTVVLIQDISVIRVDGLIVQTFNHVLYISNISSLAKPNFYSIRARARRKNSGLASLQHS